MRNYVGKYIEGQGKAHTCCEQHRVALNCKPIGTFNIKFDGKLLEQPHTIETEKLKYWFVRIDAVGGGTFYGWAIRPKESNQIESVIELLTKVRLPAILKTLPLNIQFFEPWDKKRLDSWADEQYWFQGFPFLQKKLQRADSQLVWDYINTIDWSGKTVLDIGCHTGYFSFKASHYGAQVTGYDTNNKTIAQAMTIQGRILPMDVRFTNEEPKGRYDVIFYLSVHHQPDPTYSKLAEKIDELTKRACECLFVELIMPPMFPTNHKLLAPDIDEIVGGEILATYQHKVRGIRRIYKIDCRKGAHLAE